jgi:hypothetical protein
LQWGHFGSRAQAFFEAVAGEQRPRCRDPSAHRSDDLIQCRTACSAISGNTQSACFSNRAVLPPLGLAAILTVSYELNVRNSEANA